MIFKMLEVKNDIRDARNDPSGFVAGKLVDGIRGIFLFWKIVLILPLIPFAIFGFTGQWGGPFVWVRVVTFIWLGIVIVAFMVMRVVTRFMRRKTRKVADAVVSSIRDSVTKEEEHE